MYKQSHTPIHYFILAIMITLPFAASSDGLSDSAKKGETYFSACLACHDETRNPPLGPPMYGVQNRYMKLTANKTEFVNAIKAFVVKPEAAKVQMKEAYKTLGLMPAMALPDDMLTHIANYLYEFDFPPPCTHWRLVVSEAEKSGQIDNHIRREKKKIERFCQ